MTTQTLHATDAVEFSQVRDTLRLPTESLFTTDVDLWPIYLNAFPDPAERQHHNCSACRHFIHRYGHLVTIDPQTGVTTSAVWNLEAIPPEYYPAFYAMKAATEAAKVTGVFLSSKRTLGTPVTGDWTHFAVANPRPYRDIYPMAGQRAAEKREDYRNVSRALGEFRLPMLEQVFELLSNDSLYRSEKVLGQARWLYNLKKATEETLHRLHRNNIIWKATADAPAGFCHPRSSMIGTLLEDLGSGMSFKTAAARFKDKMHPLQYQRPQAPPKSGAILEAEKLVKTLGLEPSLERRFATLEDMQTIWRPTTPDKFSNAGGVFEHLKQDKKEPLVADSGKITWVKFRDEVLPKAKRIEVFVPYGRSDFVTFLTAKNPEAPLIFQWDNPVSWYRYHGGREPRDYFLDSGWVEARALCLMPYMWEDKPYSNSPKDFSFILQGARDKENRSNCLFPETLRSEFHGIRSVIEAHSQATPAIEIEEEHVIGKNMGSRVRVHTSVITQYTIDRWD